jgi:L-alanine-DL-glutamate epimerase-like enolase superfamily enzyme
MPKPTDVRPREVRLYFIPAAMRLPLKFGPELTTEVTLARVQMRVEDRSGRSAWGWGETPIMPQWVWPGAVPYAERVQALKELHLRLRGAWADFAEAGHPLEVGQDFQHPVLERLLAEYNRTRRSGQEPVPWLAALVCCSAFDLALHDAYGVLHGLPVYATYTEQHLSRDLAAFLEPDEGAAGKGVRFARRYPAEFLVLPPPSRIDAWHLVGGTDPLEPEEASGSEPQDGYPVFLRDWIRRDGLDCLKVKLRGNDAAWDYQRLARVGRIGTEEGATRYSADFNCTVQEPHYVTEVLERLAAEEPETFARILYVEQPFPYDLEAHRIDVRSISALKPLFMDESAHDWRLVCLGRHLGWNGVALKTCKTQSGAILSLCWAKAHGMSLMVQDLSNPALAMIPHALLAAHAGTIAGVETNSSQFYPEASLPERAVHPGLYRRREGMIDLSTLRGPGFGYRIDEIRRPLPAPEP